MASAVDAASDVLPPVRWLRYAAGLLVPVVLGVVVAVSPFWIGVRGEMARAGSACVFEHDPGSGASATGVERMEWGLTPQLACIPIGPPRMATSGPEFDAAAQPALAGETPDTVTPDVLRHHRSHAYYELLWLPAAGLATAAVWLLVGITLWQRDADRRTRAAMEEERATSGW